MRLFSLVRLLKHQASLGFALSIFVKHQDNKSQPLPSELDGS